MALGNQNLYQKTAVLPFCSRALHREFAPASDLEEEDPECHYPQLAAPITDQDKVDR